MSQAWTAGSHLLCCGGAEESSCLQHMMSGSSLLLHLLYSFHNMATGLAVTPASTALEIILEPSMIMDRCICDITSSACSYILAPLLGQALVYPLLLLLEPTASRRVVAWIVTCKTQLVSPPFTLIPGRQAFSANSAP